MACRLTTGGKRPLLALLSLATVLFAAGPAAEAQQVSAQQRKSAAEAYDRGTSAWLAGQYAQAAQWFETAHRLAPSAAALVQAIRSHAEAGNGLRAASLSLWLKAEYDEDPRATKVADGILEDAEGNYGKVAVKCDDDCTLAMDGKVQEYREFFVEPGMKHTVTAGFTHGDVSQEVKVGHGDRAELSFEAPPPPPEPEPGDPGYVAPHKPPKERWPGVAPWVTATILGIGVLAIAPTVWSAVDTKNAANSYEAWAAGGAAATNNWTDPEPMDDGAGGLTCVTNGTDWCYEVQSRYDAGKKLERRTNILIGATGGVLLISAVMAIFMTDWKGKRYKKKKAGTVDDGADEGGVEVTAGFGWQPGGGMAMIEGRF
jgi:hypothetical protein